MKYSISTFMDLPVPIKAALLIASGASLGTVVTIIPPGARLIVLIGLVVIVLVLLLYCYLLKRLKKRKAVPMERDLMKNASAATLVAGSDPKVMAQQDDLRKKFERGIEEFRAHGNDFYDIPWYMVVGEPGSGKTEAIRHSNIGFPPGVQDMLQGSGGTINMNWWFTQDAVILDTAGRMMFEQVEEGGGHDWKEFLNLLKKYRKDCPINGVLLVIPADSLIRDTADEIGKKADKIAQQFDVIQRTLGVRFPVFVVITKSDLINGFRDFFDNITDPQLQHQILGWSNTEPIDEPYRSEFIDQHVKVIKECLYRRRLLLMQQMICGESGIKEKRLIDILYTFPQSITNIAPRLARYLELIFKAGSRWSGKPLFFRGIYFTSSMREGSALDWELAENLGVPVDSLPDGRVWERDRAYFLRDLLLKKVFPEEGLVTSAIDAKKQHSRRKFFSLIAIAASVLLLFVYMVCAQGSYTRSIENLNKYLLDTAKLFRDDPNKLRVVQAYPNDSNDYLIMEEVLKKNLPGKLADAVRNYKTKWFFIPLDWWVSDISVKARDATKITYEASVLKSFLRAASKVMIAHENEERYEWSRENDSNDPNELCALLQLIRIRATKPLSKEEKNDYYSRSNFLDYLKEYIIGQVPSSLERRISRNLYDTYKTELHKPLKLEYKIFDKDWKPATIMYDDPVLLNDANVAVNTGIDLFNKYWQKSDAVQDINKLKFAIEDFNRAETDILNLREPSELKAGRFFGDKWQEFLDKWMSNVEKMKKAREDIPARFTDGPNDFKDLCDKTIEDVNDSYHFLLKELDPNTINEDEFLDGIQVNLINSRDNIKKALDDARKYLEPLEKKYWTRIHENRLLEIRFNMYSRVSEWLNVYEESFFDFNAIQTIKDEESKISAEIDQVTDASLTEVSKLCNYVLILSVLRDAPSDVNEIEEFVKRESMSSDWDWEVTPNRKYDPEVAADLMNGWKYLGGIIDRNRDFAVLKETYNQKDAAFVKYSEYYGNYWLGTAPREWIAREWEIKDPNETWRKQVNKLNGLQFSDARADLEEFRDYIDTALKMLNITDNEKKRRFDDHKNRIDLPAYQDMWKKILDNWKHLSDNTFDARKTILTTRPDYIVEEYFPSPKTYRPDSPEEFVYMYWTKLAENSLEILINDTERMAGKQIDKNIDNYSNKFPLKWDWDSSEEFDPNKELDLNGVKELHSILDNFPLWDNKTEIIEKVTATGIPEYKQLYESLKRLSEPLVPDIKRIDRIRQVVNGLPREGKPYYCKILFNKPSSVVYTRRFEIEQNGLKSGRLGIDSSVHDANVLTVEYGTDKSIFIKFYRYLSDNVEDSNVVVLGSYRGDELSFEGRWAILLILYKYTDIVRDNEVFIRVPFKDKIQKENKEEIVDADLSLKLMFCRDKNCQVPIPGFVQALLSKE